MSKKSNQINKLLNKACLNKNDHKTTNIYQDMYQENTGIIELKYKDFTYDKKTKSLKCNHKIFKDIKKGIIIFYAPWCKHCIDMYDDIIELSINYMNIFPIAVVNIEDLQNKNDLLTSYAYVTKYPTMKVLNKNLILENYNNDLTKDNITYYINMNM
jgi:thiol-disulfide isomerase/thioredoxin